MSKDKNYAFNLDDENPDSDSIDKDDSNFDGEIPEKIEWLDDIQGGDLIDEDDFDDDLEDIEGF